MALHPRGTGTLHRIIAIAPDLLGFGGSEKPWLEYTPELQLGIISSVLDDCLKRLQYVDLDEIGLSLVGHSMRSILALLPAAGIADGTGALPGRSATLGSMVLLGTPYASLRHVMQREALRSPFTRAMLSSPLIGQLVHSSSQGPLAVCACCQRNRKGNTAVAYGCRLYAAYSTLRPEVDPNATHGFFRACIDSTRSLAVRK